MKSNNFRHLGLELLTLTLILATWINWVTVPASSTSAARGSAPVGAATSDGAPVASESKARETYGQLPLNLEANQVQTDRDSEPRLGYALAPVGPLPKGIYAEGRGAPWISLRDGFDLPNQFDGTASSFAQSLENSQAESLSLTAADFDEDGMPDLISGYAAGGSGFVTMRRGNVDAVYPNSPKALRHKLEGSLTDVPFLSPTSVFQLPQPPEFLGAGDFDNDGHWDIVATARGSNLLSLLRGDGRGGFGPPEQIELPGAVTTMVTGEINRADGLMDLVVGIVGPDGPRALVFEGPEGALKSKPEVLALPAAATSMALGQFDKDYLDLVLAAGNDLMIVQGRDRKLSLTQTEQAEVGPAVITHRLWDSPIKSIAAGNFTGDDETSLALLFDDGSVRVTSPGKSKDADWNIETRASAAYPEANRLVRARLSSRGGDDLVLIDSSNHQLHILEGKKKVQRTGGQMSASSESVPSEDLVSASLDVQGEPVAVLSMLLNSDAISDLVVLRKGNMDPATVMSATAATFTVTNTNDGGAGSLKQAIIDANASPGADTITFSIGSGPRTLSAGSGLGNITEAVTIDGTTQPGFSGIPIIQVPAAFMINAGNTTVRGFVINGVTGNGAGVVIQAGGGNLIEGNYIGTDSTGSSSIANTDGVICRTSNNLIGRDLPGGRNVISGNTQDGIRFEGGSSNQVRGNYIGTNAAGTAALGNGRSGVFIQDANNNSIGGTIAAARNVISGNCSEAGCSAGGIRIVGFTAGGSSGNLVQGNFIGTNVSGTAALPNIGGGLVAFDKPNTIGGTATGAGNVISGNSGNGVSLSSQNNPGGFLVQGNFIGLNAAGTAALGNSGEGVSCIHLSNSTIGGATTAARNIVSGNGGNGVSIGGSGGSNTIQGNFIGTNASGAAALGNGGHGVSITGGGNSNNTIGGAATSPGTPPGNLISGNKMDGVHIDGSPSNGVFGNLIGTSADGSAALGNSGSGVFNNSTNLTIGGTTSGARNVVSGNGSHGIDLFRNAGETLGTTVQGNYVGVNAAGTAALGNGGDGLFVEVGTNTIGGTGAGAGNVISGNIANGIELQSNGNLIQGNFIGTNVSGTAALGNGGDGVRSFAAGNNLIGGTTVGARNIISGNKGHGIEITFNSLAGNPPPGTTVQGNSIGVGLNGAFLGNLGSGVFLDGVPGNQIGGAGIGAGNTIAHNGGNGVTITSGASNPILSNSIFSNQRLGIDLGNNGPTANDHCDQDGAPANSPNRLRNFPTLTSTTSSGGSTTIAGTLDSRANTTFRLEFFANEACDGTGFGQGKTFIGSTSVTTDGNCAASFNVSLPVAVSPGQVVTATSTDPDGNTSEFSQCGAGIFGISSLSPNRGGDTGTLSVVVQGKAIAVGVTVKLVRAGQADIVGNPVAVINGGTAISARFDLTGKAQGAWDVVATNPDGTSASLPGAFTIEQGRAAKGWADILGPSTVGPHRNTLFNVVYGNLGNVDVYDVLLLVHLPKGATVTGLSGLVVPPGVQPAPGLDGVSIQTDSETLIPVWFYVLPAGVSRSIILKINMQDTVPAPGQFGMRAQVLLPPPSESEFARTGDYATLPSYFGPSNRKNPFFLALLAWDLGQAYGQVKAGGVGVSSHVSKSGSLHASDTCPPPPPGKPFDPNNFNPNDPNFNSAATFNNQLNNGTLQGAFDTGPIPAPYAYTGGIVLVILGGAAVVAGSVPIAIGFAVVGGALTIWGIISTGNSYWQIKCEIVAASSDPNEMVGPSGVGSQRYISGQEPLRYAIDFANKPDASAPAQTVVVTDQLDTSKMDLSTFSLGPIAFGDATIVTPPFGQKTFNTDVDLRPAKNLIVRIQAALNLSTGVATWTLQSIDPATNEPPNDPLVGFLPPNVNGTEGEGSVLFTVMPKNNSPAGTEIRDKATIVFDDNAPIATNEWLNTIDNTNPVSHVSALAATQASANFNVNWSGTDTGSGIRDFTVYVSENGGPYTLWLGNTTQTSALFNGQPSKTYSFFSVATDQANNQEAIKTTAEATTTVAASPTIQFSSAGYSVSEGSPRVDITLTRSGDTTSSASVNFATNDGAGLTNCNVFNGIASPRCDYINTQGTMSFAAGETSKSFSIAIVDDSYVEGSETFTIGLNSPSGTTLGAQSTATVTIIDNDSSSGTNPIDSTNFFVRQQYIDFLGREPDPPGFAGWTSTINNCTGDTTQCDRIHVSQLFFQSEEFQSRGYFVYRFYPVAFGRKPDYAEFVPDLARVSGFLDNNQLEAAKVQFIADLMARTAFVTKYNSLNNTQYVDTLLSTAGVTLSSRQAMIDGLNNSTLTRAAVLRQIAESTEVSTRYNHQAYAVMEYFGYLRRQPDAFYLDWIRVLDQSNDPRGMVTGFVNSTEYRQRFGP
jgi:hypothetical protein